MPEAQGSNLPPYDYVMMISPLIMLYPALAFSEVTER